jgi:ribosomal protein S12 methylthiotransferase accessory factor YcaO
MLDAKMLPPGINRKALAGFAAEVDGREAVLRAMIERFERRYGSLAELEARLDKGQGSEHPDWEEFHRVAQC